MFRLEKEQRTATPEEAGTLAAYSGFGYQGGSFPFRETHRHTPLDTGRP